VFQNDGRLVGLQVGPHCPNLVKTPISREQPTPISGRISKLFCLARDIPWSIHLSSFPASHELRLCIELPIPFIPQGARYIRSEPQTPRTRANPATNHKSYDVLLQGLRHPGIRAPLWEAPVRSPRPPGDVPQDHKRGAARERGLAPVPLPREHTLHNPGKWSVHRERVDLRVKTF
jgi:hypothetical protein